MVAHTLSELKEVVAHDKMMIHHRDLMNWAIREIEQLRQARDDLQSILDDQRELAERSDAI